MSISADYRAKAQIAPHQHGTYSGYSWYGCRCPRCLLQRPSAPLPFRERTLVPDLSVPYPAWDVR